MAFDVVLVALTILSMLVVLAPLPFTLRFFRRARRRETAERLEYPGLTVLKPVRGLDDDLEKNLRSHFEQDYAGPWEIVFCVHEASDPAVEVIERVRADYPQVASRLVFSTHNPRWLGKINNLVAGEAAARYEVLLNADSDVAFDRRDYLAQYVAPLARDPRVGVVSCYALYQGARNAWAALRAAHYNHVSLSVPSMLFQLGRMRFATGSLVAFRRDIVRRLGGFGAIGDRLADDAMLARAAIAQGYTIELSHLPALVAYYQTPFRDWALHLHRWLVNYLTLAPRVFAAFPLNFGLLYAALFVARHPGDPAALGLLACAAGVRLGAAAFTNLVFLRRHAEWRLVPLLPLIDLVVLPIAWAWVLCFHRTISWRGVRYAIASDGRIRQLRPRVTARGAALRSPGGWTGPAPRRSRCGGWPPGSPACRWSGWGGCLRSWRR